MRKSLLLVAALIALISCKEEENIIEKKKYIEFLTEVHIANSLMGSNYSILRNNDLSTQYYNIILDKHKLTREQVFNTVIYYKDKPKEYAKIYEEIDKRLNELKKEYDSLGKSRLYKNLITNRSNKYINNKDKKQLVKYIVADSLKSGNYVFTSKIRLHKSDETEKPQIEFIAKYKDSTTDTVFEPVQRDKEYKLYRVSYFTDTTKTLDSLKIIVYRNEVEKSVKRFDITDPSVAYKGEIYREDSVNVFK